MPTQTFFNLPKEKQERIMDATLNELSLHAYESLNLANIIRESQIPRGSFYQYFKDKNDLFDYFLTYVAMNKFKYWGDLFTSNQDLPFLERFYQIYIKGFYYAKENPRLVKAAKKMMDSDYYKQSPRVKEGLKQAVTMYAGFIECDQKLGRIRKDIEPRLLANFILEFMNKVTLDEYLKDDIHLENIEDIVNQLIDILKKGIE
ncbi:TetR/AcrR family transcriptional regulator [Peloplasma aerotolerans]|uniref:TetR/AcrR family transcriptional regulator n=1 Tax=Peloplasma aerotolerans TaxID=3044389 RepID=A0AAW6U8P8_9MOLU|nr:TetR/AcrR family transcriptional regulator [Mariniplasma sp. M4Ah]MDI6452478.1 TetR/AcrR family transcriptional regulator [Mariniplasma sp. M4Ah]